MSNFEDIIKQKTEQFDVPYNEAHWKKVEQQLDTIKVARIRKSLFIAAGVLTIASVFGVWMYQTQTSDNSETSSPITQTYVNEEHHSTMESTNSSDNNVIYEQKNTEHSLTQNTTQKQHGISYQNNNSIEKVNSISPNDEKLIIDNNIPNPVQPNNNNINKPPVETIKLNAEFIVYNNKVCLGEQVSFEAFEKKKVSYLWDFGDGTTSTKANPVHNYLSAGDYTVNLTVTDNSSGKKASYEVKSAASILPLPAADFSYTEQAEKHDANKLKYPYTLFSAKGDDSDSYSWNFGNGQTSKAANPKIIYNEKGVFKAALTITNSFGCTQSISKLVTINHPFDLYAPNAFSPNLDGDNDIFIPKGLLTWDVQFEMIIKSQSGDVIYKTTDKNNGWNGKYNNTGVVLDPGIYFWQVITYDAEGATHRHVGKINLIK